MQGVAIVEVEVKYDERATSLASMELGGSLRELPPPPHRHRLGLGSSPLGYPTQMAVPSFGMLPGVRA